MPVIDPASAAYTGTPATGITLCEQLGRLWAERSTLAHAQGAGLTFAEAADESPANLYARALPRRAHRLDWAASIVCDADQREGGGDTPGAELLVAVECHAPTPRHAVALGADLLRCLLPGRGIWNEPVTRGGADLWGAVGFPDLDPGDLAAVWRLLAVQVASGPRAVPLAALSPTDRTADGQALAVLQLIVTAVSIEWLEPA